MKLQVQSWNNGGSVYNAEAEETAILDYSITHRFNEPAEAVIILQDPTGTIAQKYNIDANDVYVGPGKVTIEDPTGTDIFYGRIMKAEADTASRTVKLTCLDWLSQLDEEQITYDMREDLDPTDAVGLQGLRESYVYPDYDDTDGNGIRPAFTSFLGSEVYDARMNWVADTFNNMYFVLSDRMAGSITMHTSPYDYTLTAGGGSIDVFDNDISDLWADDGNKHIVGDVGGDWDVDYNFRIWVPDSDFYSSCTGARVRIVIGSGSDVYLQLYNGGTYDTIAEDIGTVGTAIVRKTIEISKDLLATMFDASGEVILKFKDDDSGAIYVYYVAVECDFETTGYSGAPQIWDVDNGNRLRIDGVNFDSDTYRVWHGCPYSIARKIYKHIHDGETPGDIVADGDTMVELTCGASVENTSGISTRQYIDKTRLEILQDLAKQDKAEFWIPLGTVDVNYKSTWNAGAAAETLTDTDVNAWHSTFDYSTVANKCIAQGMRIGDRQLKYAYTNATSTAKYHATRTRVIKDSGLVSEYDVKTRATVTATKYGDPQQILTATIRGNTATAAHPKTIVIGDEIQVTSTYLGLTNAWYIVQRFNYTTTENMTTLLLHPRVSATGLQKEEIGSFEQAMQTNRRGSSDPYVPPPAEDVI